MAQKKQSERRRVENEMTARAENDRLRQTAQAVLDQVEESDLPLNFLCECADLSCTETVPLSVSNYQSIHKHKAHFAVRPGHEQLGIERIIERKPDYYVIEKRSEEFLPER